MLRTPPDPAAFDWGGGGGGGKRGEGDGGEREGGGRQERRKEGGRKKREREGRRGRGGGEEGEEIETWEGGRERRYIVVYSETGMSELTEGICVGSSEQKSALASAPTTWRQSVLAGVWRQDGAWREGPMPRDKI